MKRLFIAVLIVTLVAPVPFGDHIPLWLALYMYAMVAFDLLWIVDQRVNAGFEQRQEWNR